MKTSWQEGRKEIAIWLSGYLSMVKKWVDKILDNEDHDINKNKIISTIDEWIQFLTETRDKIMVMPDSRPIVPPTVDDPDPKTEAEVESREIQERT